MLSCLGLIFVSQMKQQCQSSSREALGLDAGLGLGLGLGAAWGLGLGAGAGAGLGLGLASVFGFLRAGTNGSGVSLKSWFTRALGGVAGAAYAARLYARLCDSN